MSEFQIMPRGACRRGNAGVKRLGLVAPIAVFPHPFCGKPPGTGWPESEQASRDSLSGPPRLTTGRALGS